MNPQFPSQAAATFVYDGGCGFCARAALALGRITLDDGPSPALEIASSSDFPFEESGVDATLIERHALYVETRSAQLPAGPPRAGSPRSEASPVPSAAPPFLALGHRAIGHALRDHGRTYFWRFAGAVLLNPLMNAPASIVYRLVADNRGVASRVTEGAAKQVASWTRRRP